MLSKIQWRRHRMQVLIIWSLHPLHVSSLYVSLDLWSFEPILAFVTKIYEECAKQVADHGSMWSRILSPTGWFFMASKLLRIS